MRHTVIKWVTKKVKVSVILMVTSNKFKSNYQLLKKSTLKEINDNKSQNKKDRKKTQKQKMNKVSLIATKIDYNNTDKLISQFMTEVEGDDAKKKEEIEKSLEETFLKCYHSQTYEKKLLRLASAESDFQDDAFHAQFLSNLSTAEDAKKFIKSFVTKNNIIL